MLIFRRNSINFLCPFQNHFSWTRFYFIIYICLIYFSQFRNELATFCMPFFKNLYYPSRTDSQISKISEANCWKDCVFDKKIMSYYIVHCFIVLGGSFNTHSYAQYTHSIQHTYTNTHTLNAIEVSTIDSTWLLWKHMIYIFPTPTLSTRKLSPTNANSHTKNVEKFKENGRP